MTVSDSTHATKALLSQLTRGLVDAINRRDFDPLSPAYSHVSPIFIFDLDACHKYTLAGLLELKSSLAKLCPKFRIELHDMVIGIDESLGIATVFANMVWADLFPERGVEMTSVFVTEFQQLLEGDWRIVRQACPSGHDFAGDIRGL